MDHLLEMGIEKKGHRIAVLKATTTSSHTSKQTEGKASWSWNSKLF